MPRVSLSNVASPYAIDLSALAPNLDPPLPERVPGALQRQCSALTRFPRSTIHLFSFIWTGHDTSPVQSAPSFLTVRGCRLREWTEESRHWAFDVFAVTRIKKCMCERIPASCGLTTLESGTTMV